MSHIRLTLIVACALLAGATLGAGPAPAGPISPGFDLFETVSPGTSGITPFGLISFMGVAFPTANNLGTTDTIVQRMGGLPAGGTGTIPIELVALHLVSLAPIVVPPFGPVDMHALVNQGGIITGLPSTALTPSTGLLTVTSHTDPTGGTFSSFFDVFVEIRLTPPGGNVNNPLISLPFNEGRLQAAGVPWSHTAPPGYPFNPLFPPGNFFPSIQFMETGPNAMHTVRPPTGLPIVPEPSTLTLLCIGAIGLLGYKWRRRTKEEILGPGDEKGHGV